ncbi:ribosome small subunit-dependent GTPase A [Shimia gijangensis]|uniref:ribosome small subunit-dependent GTPase A n=1 Tax=Shimia gijangensis TaxID=1470563 RepID=UPI001FE4EA39|nr:ribosome small subunit-dependent GTPase A [Shimia gijangensis]
MTNFTLTDLGWSPHFAAQCDDDDLCHAARVTSIARDRVFVLTTDGPLTVLAPSDAQTSHFAVGDWVILTTDHVSIERRLTPHTNLERRAAGTGVETQLIAANVDTLAIVSSCNADFNEARLERYLALALTSGCLPLVVLTKSDLCDDPRDYVRRAERLSPLVTALALNATAADEAELLAPWCKDGQTIALLGSSGVGKSTLSNALTASQIETQAIREDDAKGRHTTTVRELFRTRFGGWLIDTPGMRALRLADASEGIEAVFGDIEDLARNCRFSNCAHETEPDCAVLNAVERGELTPDRLDRWRKLLREDAHNSATLHEAHRNDRNFGKMVRSAMKDKHGRRR